jgi:4-amino-4-deoxy-L-arabinose transferase-like glycosyltransferase
MPLVAGTLLLGYRLWKRPSLGRAAALGFVGALAGLTRSEGLLLLILVVGCVAVLRHGLPRAERVQLVVVALVIAAVTVAPWFVYNATRFEEPVLMSTNDGATIADTNCPAAYSGPFIGLYVFQCHVPAVDESGDESQRAQRLTRNGLHYAREHASRVPVVVAARVGRVWGLFRPLQTIESEVIQPWSERAAYVLFLSYSVVALAGLAGFFVLRRRRVPISPLVSTLVAVTVIAAATYGVIRFRIPGDVTFVVLAAVTIDAILARDFPPRRASAPPDEWTTSLPGPATS